MSKARTTYDIDGIAVKLPPNGRIGSQIEFTFRAVRNAGAAGIALYKALSLTGTAARYGDRYRAAWCRFADANPNLLESGRFGKSGAFGYRWIGPNA